MVKTSCCLSSDSSGSWWAATVATYCPGRVTEHPKCKSTGGYNHPDCSPCTYLARDAEDVVVDELDGVGPPSDLDL